MIYDLKAWVFIIKIFRGAKIMIKVNWIFQFKFLLVYFHYSYRFPNPNDTWVPADSGGSENSSLHKRSDAAML